MNITDCVHSVLIIDDSEDEVVGLKDVLRENDIHFVHYNPVRENNELPCKNRQLVFCDLYLNSTTPDLKGNIALLRKILKKVATPEFGSYGIVLWTKHNDEIDELKEKLSIDHQERSYNTPLFIVALDKQEYLEKGFTGVWTDLEEKLKGNEAAYFFFNWRNSVIRGADKALSDIYHLVSNYQAHTNDLLFLLYHLAVNYSGMDVHEQTWYEGMYKDAYKAFDELLSEDLALMQMDDDVDIFSQIKEKALWDADYKQQIHAVASLNSKLLIESADLHQERNLPGSVYEVKDPTSLLYINDEALNISAHIAIELTPPCDFAHKKVYSRLVGGYIINLQEDDIMTSKALKKIICKHKADSKYLIYPIHYNGELRLICFDFRYLGGLKGDELANTEKFKLLFMAKSKLFADILQKFSSHASRLGLSIINL
jgi:hypothetical protein